MNKSGNSVTFRKSLGGFKKKDVVSYIAEENSKFNEIRAALNDEIQIYMTKVSELEEKLKYAEESALKTDNSHIETVERLKAAISERDAVISENTNEISRINSVSLSYEKEIEQLAEKVEQINTSIDELLCENENLRHENYELNEKNKLLAKEKNILESKLKNVGEKSSPINKVSADNISDISEKAIDAITLIKKDVKSYVTSCVDDFDAYSHEISSGIYKLLEDINLKCRQLDMKIKENRTVAAKNITEHFDKYENQ